MKNKIVFLIVCASVMLSSLIWATVDRGQMEIHYTDVAQRSLDAAYGPNNFVVKVSVELTTAQYSLRYTEQSKPRVTAAPKDNGGGQKINILPGYPVIKNLGSEDANKFPFDSVTTYAEPQVRKIVVDAIVNKSFPKGQAGRAQALLKTVLDLKDGRDQINFTYQPFYNLPKPGTQEIIMKQSTDLFTMQNLFYLVVMVLAILFTLVYVFFQWRGNKQLAAVKGGGGEGGGSTNISVNPSFELPKGSGGGGTGGNIQLKQAPQIKRYFDFISDDNIEPLTAIIKAEKLPADQIAIIAASLSSDLTARLLGSLELNEQAIVSTAMLSQKMIARPVLDKLEARIKDRLECMVGGEPVFKGVFNLVSSDTKKKLLATLIKTDPTGYKGFRANVIIFDDLKLLEDAELKLLLSEVNLEKLATAMVSTDEKTNQKIEVNLTANAKDVVKQFLDFKGKSTPKKDIEAAQDNILSIVTRLENQGKIKLRAKIKG